MITDLSTTPPAQTRATGLPRTGLSTDGGDFLRTLETARSARPDGVPGADSATPSSERSEAPEREAGEPAARDGLRRRTDGARPASTATRPSAPTGKQEPRPDAHAQDEAGHGQGDAGSDAASSQPCAPADAASAEVPDQAAATPGVVAQSLLAPANADPALQAAAMPAVLPIQATAPATPAGATTTNASQGSAAVPAAGPHKPGPRPEASNGAGRPQAENATGDAQPGARAAGSLPDAMLPVAGRGPHDGTKSTQDGPATSFDRTLATASLVGTWAARTPTSAQDAQPTQRVEVQAPVTSPGFGPELGDRVSMLVAEGIERAEITVTPKELGPVRIELTLSGDDASMVFTAAHPDTRQAIEQSAPLLRSMLAEHGLSLGQLDVGRGDTPKERPAQDWQPRRESNAGQDDTGGLARPAVPTATRARGLLDLFA
jgi:flagellar hook-length control protein FliK